jgi:hypothetical protein
VPCLCTEATAAELKRQGIDIDLIWDEGALVMSEGISERLNTPVALVATAEKVTVDAEVRRLNLAA